MSDDPFEEKTTDNRGRKAELLEIQNTMRTEGGRNLVWRILKQSGIFTSVFDSDPIIHAMNAGQRENGLWLEQELKEASPDLYLKMLKEHINE